MNLIETFTVLGILLAAFFTFLGIIYVTYNVLVKKQTREVIEKAKVISNLSMPIGEPTTKGYIDSLVNGYVETQTLTEKVPFFVTALNQSKDESLLDFLDTTNVNYITLADDYALMEAGRRNLL